MTKNKDADVSAVVHGQNSFVESKISKKNSRMHSFRAGSIFLGSEKDNSGDGSKPNSARIANDIKELVKMNQDEEDSYARVPPLSFQHDLLQVSTKPDPHEISISDANMSQLICSARPASNRSFVYSAKNSISVTPLRADDSNPSDVMSSGRSNYHSARSANSDFSLMRANQECSRISIKPVSEATERQSKAQVLSEESKTKPSDRM